MHECGHGLYEHGVSPSLERTPLCRGTSLGIHESQSRLWENLVGRGSAAWRFFLPELKKAFPQQLGDVDLETFYRAINKVQPGLIRVEADELTYGLHVVLRFELEQEMLSGALALDELPDAWNARMKSYLGVDVPDAASGVLQDVHWSLGYVGYFPTYVIGSIVSAQIWEKAVEAMPDLEGQFERGEFLPLREWLRENLHRHGRKFTPKETLQKVTGTDAVQVGPYMKYLTRSSPRSYRARRLEWRRVFRPASVQVGLNDPIATDVRHFRRDSQTLNLKSITSPSCDDVFLAFHAVEALLARGGDGTARRRDRRRRRSRP